MLNLKLHFNQGLVNDISDLRCLNFLYSNCDFFYLSFVRFYFFKFSFLRRALEANAVQYFCHGPVSDELVPFQDPGIILIPFVIIVGIVWL